MLYKKLEKCLFFLNVFIFLGAGNMNTSACFDFDDIDDEIDNEYRANVNEKYDFAKVENEEFENVKLLADVNGTDGNGWTALHVASIEGHQKIVKYLVKDRKASVDVTDNDDDTPLHLASKTGCLEAVKCLVENGGAKIDLPNKKCNTALHLALKNENFRVARYLVEKGARIDKQNKKKEIPLILAKKKEFTDAEEYLLLVTDMYKMLKKDSPLTVDAFVTTYLSTSKDNCKKNVIYVCGLLHFFTLEIADKIYFWLKKMNYCLKSGLAEGCICIMTCEANHLLKKKKIIGMVFCRLARIFF